MPSEECIIQELREEIKMNNDVLSHYKTNFEMRETSDKWKREAYGKLDLMFCYRRLDVELNKLGKVGSNSV